GFARLVRFSGGTVPNIMRLTRSAPGERPREIARKKFYPGNYVAVLIGLWVLVLSLGGGILTAILVPSCGPTHRVSATTAYLSFTPPSLSLVRGETKKVRLVVSRTDYRARGSIRVQLHVPSGLSVPSTELEVEKGQEEMEIAVKAARAGR